MTIQSLDNQYIIKIEQSSVSLGDIQKMLDYLSFKSIVAKSQATETDIEQLSADMKQSSWQKIQTSLLARINP